MNKLTSFVFVLVIGTTLSTVFAANGFCRRCKEINEERLRNPQKEYTYYEDYLEANGGRQTAISNENNNNNNDNNNNNNNDPFMQPYKQQPHQPSRNQR